MELTGQDFDRIPQGNLSVPVVEFARLWLAAERALDAEPTSWRYFGIAQTCRWLATADVRSSTGRRYLADAPVTGRFGCAIAETIEAEALAAAKLLGQRPEPAWLAAQPGWLLAVHETFAWAWYRSGKPPITVPEPVPTRD